MNIDICKQLKNREAVASEVDARILKNLLEAEAGRGFSSKRKSFTRFKLQRVAVLVVLFVFFSFATVTASGKLLHNDWFALFRSHETQTSESSAELDSPYKQVVNQTKTLNGLTLTLDKVYFDGKILYTEAIIRSEDGGAIYKDADLAQKYQKSMNVQFFPYVFENSFNDYRNGYFTTGKRIDDGSDPKEIRLLSFTLFANQALKSEYLTISFSGISFRSEGQVNLEEKPYFPFNDEEGFKTVKQSALNYRVGLDFVPEQVELSPKEGLSLSYSDLSLSLFYDMEKVELPGWYLTEHELLESGSRYAGFSEGVPVQHRSFSGGLPAQVKVNFLDGHSVSFEARAEYHEEINNPDYFPDAAEESAQVTTVIVERADEEETVESVVPTVTLTNPSILFLTIPYSEVLSSAEIESFEIGGEVFKVK